MTEPASRREGQASATDRVFLSIGEVLELLIQEFPDVTISKIRFLEGKGLIDPERTPSGYRKFYEPDIERLRWILRQQRESFLPLKVIKAKLEAEPEASPETQPPPAPIQAVRSVTAKSTPKAVPTNEHGQLFDAEATSVSLTFDELVEASGLEAKVVRELERYELLGGRNVAGQVYFDDQALLIARLAAGFARHGVEVRHLKMFKTAAEREAGFYEQIVVPLIKQRNPAARRQAMDALTELATLGEGMRRALLRSGLQGVTGPHH